MAEKRPLYAKLQDYIMSQIRGGVWGVGDRIPPERDLASQFGVSRITAKAAVGGLVNQGYLSRARGKGTFVVMTPGTEERRAAEASGVADERVGASEGGHRGLVGLLIPWVEFRYFSSLLSGVEEQLSRSGLHLVVRRIFGEAEESRAIREFLRIPVDALIVVTSPGEHFNEEVVRLALDKFPLVLVEKTMRDIRTNSVYCDAGRGGAMMAEYLLTRGARRIGLVTYPTEFTYGVKARSSGFRTALAAGGAPALPEERTLRVPPEALLLPDDVPVPEEMIAFVAGQPEMDAIAAGDALLARLIGRACMLAGRSDMRIVCFDEPSYDRGAVFPAAYIDQSPAEAGRIAARLAMAALGGQREPQVCVIEPRLVDIS